MKLVGLLVMVVLGCGKGNEDTAPAPVVAEEAPKTPLAFAERELGSGKESPPASALVALAYAQVVANQPAAARTTLARALGIARADPKSSTALVEAAEVTLALGDRGGAAKLVDEALARLPKDEPADEWAAGLLAARGITAKLVIERLVEVALQTRVPARMTDVEGKSLAWNLVAAKIRTLPEARRAGDLVALVQIARRNNVDGGSELLEAAVAAVDPEARPDVAITVARELAFLGDPAPVRALAARVRTTDRVRLAELAAVWALAGDSRASLQFEAKATAAKEEVPEIWLPLAIARAHRNDIDGAVAIAREHPRSAQDIVAALYETQARQTWYRIVATLFGRSRHDAIARIVEIEAARGGVWLDEARARALGESAEDPPGIDHVLRAYARAGDVVAVRLLATHAPGTHATAVAGVYVGIAAAELARNKRCDEAISTAPLTASNRAQLYAVIARYCPDTKL